MRWAMRLPGLSARPPLRRPSHAFAHSTSTEPSPGSRATSASARTTRPWWGFGGGEPRIRQGDLRSPSSGAWPRSILHDTTCRKQAAARSRIRIVIFELESESGGQAMLKPRVRSDRLRPPSERPSCGLSWQVHVLRPHPRRARSFTAIASAETPKSNGRGSAFDLDDRSFLSQMARFSKTGGIIVGLDRVESEPRMDMQTRPTRVSSRRRWPWRASSVRMLGRAPLLVASAMCMPSVARRLPPHVWLVLETSAPKPVACGQAPAAAGHRRRGQLGGLMPRWGRSMYPLLQWRSGLPGAPELRCAASSGKMGVSCASSLGNRGPLVAIRDWGAERSPPEQKHARSEQGGHVRRPVARGVWLPTGQKTKGPVRRPALSRRTWSTRHCLCNPAGRCTIESVYGNRRFKRV